jgi:GTP-binding protein
MTAESASLMSSHTSVLLRETEFLCSAAALRDMPPDIGAELAFAGRSNAGKSSMINALCGRKDLARTSKTPGRTQTINFFGIDSDRRLVDLPGHGYAKASLAAQAEWQRLVALYLARRRSLAGLIYLTDIRHPLLPIDMRVLGSFATRSLPIRVVLGKADKVNRAASERAVREASVRLGQAGIEATVTRFSTRSGMGVHALIDDLKPLLHLEINHGSGEPQQRA